MSSRWAHLWALLQVSQGDEKQVAKHPGRTLLLVYPGPDDMAASALRLYKGRTLLYVGERKGSAEGRP